MKISLRRRPSQPDTSQRAAIATSGMTMAEVMMLPAVTDLVSAGKALGMGRTRSYELAQAGTFPCPVLRIGRTYQVPTAGLLTLLGAPLPGTNSTEVDRADENQGSTSDGEQASPPGHFPATDPEAPTHQPQRFIAATRHHAIDAAVEYTRFATLAL